MEFKMNPDGSMVPVDGDGANPQGPAGSPAPTAAQVHLEPGAPAGPAPVAGGAEVIKDSDTARFMQDVIEASTQVPVIVDFWAPWCGPCKQLGPALEKAVTQAGGLVRLVKINVDENQELAAQLRVQSIPAVFAFKDGRPVDGFAGALPDSQIKSFIERLLGGAKPPLEQALEAAAELLDAGNAEEALALYRQIQAEVPDDENAIAGVIRATLATGDHAAAQEIVDALPAELKSKAAVAAAVSAVELNQQATEETGDIGALRDQVAADPADHQARFELAMALFSGGQHEGAIDELLELIRRDRGWNDEAGRVQLLKMFDTLGPTDPLTLSGRKRLSSILFS